jgi:hypothetical protein
VQILSKKGQTVMENVLAMSLTNRAARNVAPMLKRRGYSQVTIESVDGKSPLEIAAALEPLDSQLQKVLADDIASAAGYKPKKGRKS